jgi:hypothetical protein
VNKENCMITNPALTGELVLAWNDKISQHRAVKPLQPGQERWLLSRFSSLHRNLSSQPRRLRRNLAHKTKLSLTDIAFMLAMGLALPASATDILVNTNIPTVNRDDLCSLMEAINNANNDSQTSRDCPAGSGADTIILQTGSAHTIANSIARRPDAGLTAITSKITVEGNDSTIHVSAVPVDLVFNIGSRGNLTLNDTTISGDVGSGTGTDGPRIHNAGILALNNVSVLLDGNRVSAITNAGLGIMQADGLEVSCGTCIGYNYASADTGHGIVNKGIMTLANASIRNLAFYGASYADGPISNSGELNLNSVVIENNYAFDGNAAVYNAGTINGTNVSINNNNTLGGLCGILNETGGSLALQNSSVIGDHYSSYYGCHHFTNKGTAVLDNVVIDSGEAVVNDGQLELTDSTVSRLDFGFRSTGNLTLNRSTITNNDGSIFIDNKATLLNSTITGNTNITNDNHPVAYPYGLRFSGDIEINHSTIGGGLMFDYGYINTPVLNSG